MEQLIKIIMEALDFTREEAIQEIKDMNQRVLEGEDPQELLYEHGIDADYAIDLIF